MAYDHALYTNEVEFFDVPDDDQIHKARLVVCANAQTAQEAEELWLMLGIHPSQQGVFESVMAPPPLPNARR